MATSPAAIVELIGDLEAKRMAISAALAGLRAIYGEPERPQVQCDDPQPVKPKPAKKQKPAKKSAKPEKTPETAQLGSEAPPLERGGLQSLVRHLLISLGPLTSLQCFELVAKGGVVTTSGSVYQTLRQMFLRKQVEKVETDEGSVAWKLVTAA